MLLLHLTIAAVVILILLVGFVLLLRAPEPVWLSAPKSQADFPDFEVEIETDWSWPR